MYGDFSRLTFDPRKHFSGVLMQQGRVTTDADFNEQSSITLHYLRRLAADLIGPCGGPEGADGFRITPAPPDLVIGAGRYYVDGVLCELDTPTTYFNQPHGFDLDRLPADVAYFV